MENSQIIEELSAILKAILGKDVTAETNRENEPAWDSLKHMQIVFAVEEQFEVQFEEEEIAELTSVKAFAESLGNKKSS